MPDRIRDAVSHLHSNTRQAYLKSGNEIISGLERLNIQSMTTEKCFIYYYFACEWMAKIFYGISDNKTVTELEGNRRPFDVRWIRKARKHLNLSITTEELNDLFYTKNEISARNIRNDIVHHFSRKTLQEIAKCETEYIPIFKKLLKEWETVSVRLE